MSLQINLGLWMMQKTLYVDILGGIQLVLWMWMICG